MGETACRAAAEHEADRGTSALDADMADIDSFANNVDGTQATLTASAHGPPWQARPQAKRENRVKGLASQLAAAADFQLIKRIAYAFAGFRTCPKVLIDP
jgi:hypothetical protein